MDRDEHNFEIIDPQLEHSYTGKEHFDHLLLFAAWNHLKGIRLASSASPAPSGSPVISWYSHRLLGASSPS
ncbi:hypothetical protein evm_010794 [Chilo suppressalis]|nr:hypothetical protein evm_010794 [Chilo suppressalis]